MSFNIRFDNPLNLTCFDLYESYLSIVSIYETSKIDSEIFVIKFGSPIILSTFNAGRSAIVRNAICLFPYFKY